MFPCSLSPPGDRRRARRVPKVPLDYRAKAAGAAALTMGTDGDDAWRGGGLAARDRRRAGAARGADRVQVRTRHAVRAALPLLATGE